MYWERIKERAIIARDYCAIGELVNHERTRYNRRLRNAVAALGAYRLVE